MKLQNIRDLVTENVTILKDFVLTIWYMGNDANTDGVCGRIEKWKPIATRRVISRFLKSWHDFANVLVIWCHKFGYVGA